LALLFDSESWDVQAVFGFRASIALLPEHAAVRVANRAADEERKKKKDEEKARWRAKEQARLNWDRRRQGSEEEEGEGGYSFELSVHWDELEGGDEDLSSQQARPFSWHASELEGDNTPLGPMELGRFALSGPSKRREGPKRMYK
jgi:hypothetical protein